jgi:predicted Rossmann fold flavoprotein
MSAIEAGKRGRRVLLLEHADRVGKKILISGGGRCNFTNLHTRPDNFLSANPHFAKSALARYTPADFVALVEGYRIAYHEKTLGQLFCDGSAKQIVAMLLSEAAKANVTIVLETKVEEVRREPRGPKEDRGFRVLTNTAAFTTEALVIATGGLSIPKMGATGFGYDIARQFGIPIRECRPGLVPLVLSGVELATYSDLSGVSADVAVSLGKRRFREKLLFTHRGLSGPAGLQISSYWKVTDPLQVDWSPDHEFLAALREPGSRRELAAVRSALRAKLPARLADRLA